MRALALISGVKTTLEAMRARAEIEFQSLYTEVENMAKKIDVAIKLVQPRIASRSVYQTGVKNLDPESHYKMTAFIPALDGILLDFSERHSSHFAHAAKLSSLIPTIVHSKNWDDLKEGYEKYKDLLSSTFTDLKIGFKIWKSNWSNAATESHFGSQQLSGAKFFRTSLHCSQSLRRFQFQHARQKEFSPRLT